MTDKTADKKKAAKSVTADKKKTAKSVTADKKKVEKCENGLEEVQQHARDETVPDATKMDDELLKKKACVSMEKKHFASFLTTVMKKSEKPTSTALKKPTSPKKKPAPSPGDRK
eukprot:13612067-Ditylum_brightwellii.AAC.1